VEEMVIKNVECKAKIWKGEFREEKYRRRDSCRIRQV
jgi:hypothetical protein